MKHGATLESVLMPVCRLSISEMKRGDCVCYSKRRYSDLCEDWDGDLCICRNYDVELSLRIEKENENGFI